MIYGIDWGAYLSSVKGPAIPFKDLHDAGLLDFFVTKGCQEADYYSSIKNIQWAREAGCQAVGSYYWHFPTWGTDYQIQVYGEAIRTEKPDFIALDMEASYGRSDWEVTTNAEAVCAGLAAEFPELPFFVYTSADYINGFCPTFNRSINKYKRWIACWPGVVQTGMARYLSFDEIKAYPLPGWKAALPKGWNDWDIWQNNNWAIPEGYGWPYDHQYDWNASKLTIEQITGKEHNTMAAQIHKTSVPMADRAWVMEIKADSKVTAGIPSLGVDAVILPMVHTPWNGNHSVVLPEPTFSGRFTEAGAVPVFGKIELDAGIATTEQHNQPEFDGHTVWQNIYIREILTAWHVGPWAQNALKPADFRPIKGLIIEQVTTEDHQTPRRAIEDFWQAYMFRYVADKLRVLMAAEAIPTVPIILKTTGTWLQKYQGDYSVMLYHPDRVKWLYLMLSDPHQQLNSTSQLPDLWSIYKETNTWDYYRYPYVPDGYADRVVLFEFTAGKQGMTFVTGNNKAYLSKAFAAAAEFDAWMGAEVVPPPPPPPPPVETGTIEARVKALEELVSTQYFQINALELQMRELLHWGANFPQPDAPV